MILSIALVFSMSKRMFSSCIVNLLPHPRALSVILFSCLLRVVSVLTKFVMNILRRSELDIDRLGTVGELLRRDMDGAFATALKICLQEKKKRENRSTVRSESNLSERVRISCRNNAEE